MSATPEHLPAAVLRPVRGHHAFEACVEQLATAIRLGVYPRGTTLPPERLLAEHLQVSRATLREAMAALREAGLVETTRGRGGGTVVTLKPRTPSARAAARTTAARRREWLDVLDFRRIVEPGAAALAASRGLDDVRLGHLQRAHAEVVAARKPAEHRQADSRFHLTVAALAESSRLVESVTSVQATLHEMLLAIPVLEANIAHSDRQHAALVKAITAGHATKARTVMEEHCDDTAALLRGLVG
ncbi:FadR family transcriptional regulator [Nocardioides anomalus]|uniref:FadR family transcriptional regulator n=1 Tax=Nocardioides anomalus TaxID=2712223 RepID=A0A6G6WDC6_9ACTN|nr:FCD domain-containing protein [Nocardioides anomalus]QIG43153.1 FadR family transcriptional regulator [Nocardioides anomalus]